VIIRCSRLTTHLSPIYSRTLHDALPISSPAANRRVDRPLPPWPASGAASAGVSRRSEQPDGLLDDRDRVALDRSSPAGRPSRSRSEEHTSELQSRVAIVCRLLLDNKKDM